MSDTGIKEMDNLDERACGNCKFLSVDRSHPHTDGHSVMQQRGWICANPELGFFSGWTTKGCCECHVFKTL